MMWIWPKPYKNETIYLGEEPICKEFKEFTLLGRMKKAPNYIINYYTDTHEHTKKTIQEKTTSNRGNGEQGSLF